MKNIFVNYDFFKIKQSFWLLQYNKRSKIVVFIRMGTLAPFFFFTFINKKRPNVQFQR